MKNLIISISVGLLSGVTVYLLIDYLFERPSKSVKPSPGVDQDLPGVDPDLMNQDIDIVYEDDDNTIPLEPSKVGNK